MALIPILWRIYDNANDPLAGGAADTSLQIRRGADGYLLDWDDLVFKAAGWVEPETQLVEDVVVFGLYAKSPDASAWDDGAYQAILRYDDGAGTIRNETGEFQVKDGAEVILGGKYPVTLTPADCSGNLPAAVNEQADIDFGATQKASITAAVPSAATIAAAVWGYATRTLSSFGTLITDIWASATRSLTDKAGFSISGTKQTLDALQDLSQVQAQAAATAALNAYDPPTRTEATADKAEVIAVATKALQALTNRLVIDPDTGAFTIYADDGTTPLVTGTITGTGRSAPTWP